MINQICHCTSIHKLNKHKQRFFVVIGKKVFCKVRTFTKRHNSNFSLYLFYCFLIFHFYYSACVVISIFLFFVVGKENFTHGSFSKLSFKNVFFTRILLNKLDFINNILKLFGSQYFWLDFTLLKLNFVTRNHLFIEVYVLRFQRVIDFHNLLLLFFVVFFKTNKFNFLLIKIGCCGPKWLKEYH